MGFRADKQGGFRPDSPAPQKQNAVTVTPQGPSPDAQADELMMNSGKFMVEVPRAMAQNMGAQIASGYAGMAGGILPGPQGQGADWQRKTAEALSFEPQSKTSQQILDVASLPGRAVSNVAHRVGERGAQVSPLLGAIGETSVEAITQLLGARAFKAQKKPLTAAEQKVADARDAGFVMTPEEMGGGVVPRTAASLAGEPRLAKLTSKKNAQLATEKAKVELGLPKDYALDLDTLADIRKSEGKNYDAARQIGQIAMDSKYMSEIDALGAKYRSAAKDFPGLAKADIEQVIAALKKEDPAVKAAQAQGIKLPASATRTATFEANSAIDLMGQLRESADKAFRAGDTGLAKVYRGGAEALERQIERHLETTAPNSRVLTSFREARERIAKTYAVEKSLVGDTVNPQALGKQVTKRKPLTGGLKETGEFARQFDRSSQKPTNMPTGATMHDLILAGLNAARNGGGSLAFDALTVGARPAMRSIIASPPAQWMMDPRTNLSGPALEGLAVSSAQPQTPSQEKRR